MSQAQAAPSSAPQPDMRTMANAIRMLAMDAVKAANSGHTGMPMGMADIATVLYSKFFRFDPKTPDWFNRDRLIVSNGHGSMLLYALAYLTGYDAMTIDEIKNFRQLHHKTPGHPEVDVSIGVETTTGPLGQGISTAVGFALAERILNAKTPSDVDHFTYVFMGDGCLMEGVSHEACSLAGHLKLGKLIAFYDENNVTIDGTIDLAFTENVAERFRAYGWHVQQCDGHNVEELEAVINSARATTDKPSIICCKTKIGFGAPTLESQPAAHGAITKDDEIAGTRKNLGWDYAPFDVPEDVLNAWRALGQQHKASGAAPKIDLADLEKITAELKASFAEEKPTKATRQLSGACLEKLVAALPMVGGSADLTGSNNTKVKASKVVTGDDYNGNYINYGVREHGMAAIMNGLALHGGIVPYSGTFMQFADYMRPAIRLAALMKQRVIHVLTHDSIGLGEDGPTHQPVEHLASLRSIPNLYVYRPCDAIETAECWELALKHEQSPSVMALTRQNVPHVCENRKENASAKGAYILKDSAGEPEVTIFASGSEVHLALEAAEKIGDKVRVVSVPCMDLFFEQDKAYIESLTCNSSKKIAIEAAVRQGWDALIGPHGTFIGMKGFGDSAPAEVLFNHFGITADAIVAAAKK
jgi:transketolase